MPAPAKRQGLVAAAPALGLGLAVLVFYLVEASLQKTPWVFTDELEWTQLSRSIAATGHAARRGQPIFFKSLYAYLIAPAWWIHSTAAAYAAIKTLNALVMCAAAAPAYLLARMLCPRRVAVAVAGLSVAIPAMSYAASIIPEPLAYLWFTLSAWLAVRALAAPRASTVSLALAAAALGPLIRKEFVVLPAAGLLAAAALWVGSDSGRTRLRLRRVLAALAGLALFGFLFNWAVVERIQHWTPGQYLNRHTLGAGALAFGALAVGLGMAPLIGGVASLNLAERRPEPAYRAFAAYLAASILTLGVYTAAKATYLAGASTLIEERNLFFLSPLLLCGSALALGARRLDWRLVAGATALVMASVWSARFEAVGAPYFEAPGLAILTLVNREFTFFVSDCRILLGGAAAVSVALLALRRRRGVPAIALVLLGAWLLTGEVYATVTDEQEANNVFAATLPPPRSWVDTATRGAPVTLLGQALNLDPSELWLTEFWNRSLDHVASLDGSAPGPGPTIAPRLVSADGTLGDYSGDPYTLAGGGVVLDAPLVAERDNYALYRTVGGWRLLKAEEGVDSDGWQLRYAYYTYFDPGGPGTLRIDLSRTAYNNPGPAGAATIEVGSVRLVAGNATIGRVFAVRHRLVPDGKEVTVLIPVPETPVTFEIKIAQATLIPPSASDPRALGVQVAFCFSRAPSPSSGCSLRSP